MSTRHESRTEVTYRGGHVGSAEYFTSRYGHGYASMVVYRFPCVGEHVGADFVLVHGIGVSARSYGPTAAELAQQGDVYLIDLPGYGRSPRPDIDMHIEDFLPRISAKTLVICGRNDPIVPLGWGRQLAEMCPHGWFATVPGPHAAMFAAPKIIASHLEEHARR